MIVGDKLLQLVGLGMGRREEYPGVCEGDRILIHLSVP